MVDAGNLEISGSIDTSQIERGLGRVNSEMDNVGKKAEEANKKMSGLGGGLSIPGVGAIGGILTSITGVLALISGAAVRDMFSTESKTPISSAFNQRLEMIKFRQDLFTDMSKSERFENKIENAQQQITAVMSGPGQQTQDTANKIGMFFDDVWNDIQIAFKTGFDPEQSVLGFTQGIGPIQMLLNAIGWTSDTLSGKETKSTFAGGILNWFFGIGKQSNQKEQTQNTPDGVGNTIYL